MKTIIKIIGASIIMLLMVSSFTAAAIGIFKGRIEIKELSFSETMDGLTYYGHLRIYVVEPVSRWNMQNGERYHFGFLDFAYDDALSIEYLDTYTDIITWDANDAGYNDIEEDNVMVMAAVFNPESHKKYAYPPAKNPFNAYYVDASAAATPGNTGHNTVTEDFTHTVFCEEATKTTCPYCPPAATALKDIYDSQDYPFYFVALVGDKNSKAYERLKNDYNLYGYPTNFFDGGYKVVVGSSSENTFRNRIQSCGMRDVHELSLSVSLDWIGNGVIEIQISVTNNEITHIPEQPSKPTGSSSGRAGVEYTYCTNTTDPDGDQLYYLFDWGEGNDSGWIGKYNSGETACANYTWAEQGNYSIKVKAKDGDGHESPWSDPLVVTMPRNKPYTDRPFLYFLQNHPLIYQLLLRFLQI